MNAAIKLFEAYILRNPRDWKTWRNLADLYLTTRQTSKAIRAYANSSQLRFDPELSLKAALLANSTGNLRDAEKGFFSLLQVADPAVAQRAHLGLLVIKHKRRQWEAVEGLLEMLDKNFPRCGGSRGIIPGAEGFGDLETGSPPGTKAKEGGRGTPQAPH